MSAQAVAAKVGPHGVAVDRSVQAVAAKPYGLIAEFDSPDVLKEAAHRAHQAGYRKMDAYSPFPIEGLDEALGFKPSRLSLIVLIGGLVGVALGYGLQYWISVIDYPILVGGKPYHSWPAFIPVTYEVMILSASIAAVVGMLALNGLPMPYHPVFNAPRFDLASNDRFFLCIESADPQFDREKTRKFLEQFHPYEVSEVAP
jgi:ActD protein